MKTKKSKTSMPMSSAGILGITSGEDIGGIKINPKLFIMFVLFFLLSIKVIGILIRLFF